jgi:hypothetical protein
MKIYGFKGTILVDDLNRFRNDYAHSLIEAERGDLSGLKKEVLDSPARSAVAPET